jgi:hypothetical protein
MRCPSKDSAGIPLSDAFFSLVTQVKQLFNLDECQIANTLIEHGPQSTWPTSRHLGQVAQVAAEKRGYGKLRRLQDL